MDPIRKNNNPVVTRDMRQNADTVFKEEEQWMSGLTPETFCHLFWGKPFKQHSMLRTRAGDKSSRVYIESWSPAHFTLASVLLVFASSWIVFEHLFLKIYYNTKEVQF